MGKTAKKQKPWKQKSWKRILSILLTAAMVAVSIPYMEAKATNDVNNFMSCHKFVTLICPKRPFSLIH